MRHHFAQVGLVHEAITRGDLAGMRTAAEQLARLPAPGGLPPAATPFVTFLASIGTCAGIYVLGFCQKRELPTDGIRIAQRNHFHPETGVLARVELDIEVPASFPEKYREALVRVADQCAVKKAIQAQPVFEVRTVVAG